MSKDEYIIEQLVYFINRLVEGDEVRDDLTPFMQSWGFWDDDGFPIENEENTE